MQIKQKPSDKTKISNQKKNKDNGLLRAQKLLRGWKSFVMGFGAFLRPKSFCEKIVLIASFTIPLSQELASYFCWL